MKQLRIIFTAICAVCIALLFPLGMIFGWIAAGICLFSAFLSFGLMLLCKQSQKEEPSERFSPLPQEDAEEKQKDDETK